MSAAEHVAAAGAGAGDPAGADGVAAIEGRGLSVAFGGVQAVRDVSFTVRPGERRVLIGPNGAGKTTLFHLIAGQRHPDRGRVLLGGRDVTRLPPHRRSRLGLARTFQSSTLLPGLTVYDNILLAVLSRSNVRLSLWRPAASYGGQRRETERIIDQWGMAENRDTPVRDLAYGEQKRLEIVLATAVQPRMLLLDEPLAGLSPVEARRVAETIAGLPRTLTLLLIDHDTDVALALADSISVMSLGRIVAEGTPGEVRSNRAVQEIYFGTSGGASEETGAGAGGGSGAETAERTRIGADGRAGGGSGEDEAGDGARTVVAQPVRPPPQAARAPAESRQPAGNGPPLLSVSGLHAGYGRGRVLQGVDLEVRGGEVVALLGRNGMGKTTLIHAIAGLLHPTAGRVLVKGRDVTGLGPEWVTAAGVALAPQGRRLFATLSVHENIYLAYRDVPGQLWSPRRIYSTIPPLGEHREQQAATLSGGEQQLAATARALVRNCDVLLLDEPSEGLAPAMLKLLGELIREARDRGLAVLLVEQKLGFALELADRALVMTKGRIVYTCACDGTPTGTPELRRHLGL